jgi:non-specific serine/threonine protein kinase
LLGASEKLSRTVGSPIVVTPGLGDFQEACERATRHALSKETFAAAHRDGAGLSFGDAIAYALGKKLPARPSPASPTVHLTKREREVVDLVAEGLTNREIATRLVISPRTAQGHVEHILTKLGFTSRAQIAAWIVETRRENS